MVVTVKRAGSNVVETVAPAPATYTYNEEEIRSKLLPNTPAPAPKPTQIYTTVSGITGNSLYAPPKLAPTPILAPIPTPIPSAPKSTITKIREFISPISQPVTTALSNIGIVSPSLQEVGKQSKQEFMTAGETIARDIPRREGIIQILNPAPTISAMVKNPEATKTLVTSAGKGIISGVADIPYSIPSTAGAIGGAVVGAVTNPMSVVETIKHPIKNIVSPIASGIAANPFGFTGSLIGGVAIGKAAGGIIGEIKVARTPIMTTGKATTLRTTINEKAILDITRPIKAEITIGKKVYDATGEGRALTITQDDIFKQASFTSVDLRELNALGSTKKVVGNVDTVGYGIFKKSGEGILGDTKLTIVKKGEPFLSQKMGTFTRTSEVDGLGIQTSTMLGKSPAKYPNVLGAGISKEIIGTPTSSIWKTEYSTLKSPAVTKVFKSERSVVSPTRTANLPFKVSDLGISDITPPPKLQKFGGGVSRTNIYQAKEFNVNNFIKSVSIQKTEKVIAPLSQDFMQISKGMALKAYTGEVANKATFGVRTGISTLNLVPKTSTLPTQQKTDYMGGRFLNKQSTNIGMGIGTIVSPVSIQKRDTTPIFKPEMVSLPNMGWLQKQTPITIQRQTPISKQDFIQLPDIGVIQRQTPVSIQRETPITPQINLPNLISLPKTRQVSIQRQTPTFKPIQETKQIQRLKYSYQPIYREEQITKKILKPFPSLPPPPPLPMIPSMFGISSSGKKKGGAGAFKSKDAFGIYAPTLEGVLFNVKTTKIPKIITGLELRGLYVGKNKKKWGR
jgi:hypothetical protein